MNTLLKKLVVFLVTSGMLLLIGSTTFAKNGSSSDPGSTPRPTPAPWSGPSGN